MPPDADGRIVPTFYSLTDEQYAAIFGKKVEIAWEPPPELDGAHFEPE